MATAVVEQQAAHIPAEWLLQLACLLRSHARLSGDLHIARRLDDRRIGGGRGGSRDRYGGSARRQQGRDVVVDSHGCAFSLDVMIWTESKSNLD
jgi:hypothetical protein